MPTNRLIGEPSPYLQQHAHNPVDWFPWGTEALEKARSESKPIFLSVGYSTCHWCHVMEHESFEDEETAEILNRWFVPIKVDREERPDIDRMYMAYVQAATGSGGWPMSVWLTPDGKPFVGGTYFPPDSRYGRPGFKDVLKRIAQAWEQERERIVESTETVLRTLERNASIAPAQVTPGTAALDSGFALWRRSFDAQLGGFGDAPKFPRPAVFHFLLRYFARTGSAEALEMVTKTLEAMSRGGMNDQLGGGFHRYSVDEHWFVPHFEKMLYDQAQIATSLIESFQITGDVTFAEEARRVLDYVIRDMTDPAGGFFSAEDADSASDAAQPKNKSEGAFYLWDAREIAAIAGEPAARHFAYRYGVERGGNVSNDPHGEFRGRNILFRAHSVEETAHHFELEPERLRQELDAVSAKLLEARGKRPRPHLDDKVLTCWNGLMISAFAQAGAALGEPRYLAAARRAADFVRTRMWDSQTGTLLRRYRDGDAGIPGFLDDFAFFIQGLLDLYASDFRMDDLRLAVELAERQRALFEDARDGAFFSTRGGLGATEPLIRSKDDYDGAEPSGNSVSMLNFFRLERLTGRVDLGDVARKALHAFGSRIESQPSGVPLTMSALEWTLSAPRQVVVVGERGAPGTEEALQMIGRRFAPGRTALLVDAESREWLASNNPAIAGMEPIDGKTAVYVCENFVCQLPVTDMVKAAELLQ